MNKVKLDPEKKKMLDGFNDKLHDALSELFDPNIVNEFDLGFYFGKTPLGQFMLHELLWSREGDY